MVRFILWLFMVGCFTGACIWGAMHLIGEDAPDKGHLAPARLPRVTVYKVKPPSPIRYLRLTGEVLEDASCRIEAPVDGIIHSVVAQPGKTLQAGAVIAQLDDALLRKEYQQVQIQYGMAQGRVQVLEGKGARNLGKLAEARLHLSKLADRLMDLETLMEQLVVRMPKPGRLAEMALKPGDRVKAGEVLTVVESGNGPLIEANLSKEDYARLKPEQNITILLGQSRTVASIYGSWQPAPGIADETSPVRTIWVHPPSMQRKLLKPHHKVDLLIPVSGLGVMQVPQAAVQWQDGQAWVFVVMHEDDKATVEARTVTVGETVSGQVEILDGVLSGEVIVLEGANLLHNKQEVAVMGSDLLESDNTL